MQPHYGTSAPLFEAARLSKEIGRQAAMIGYLDAFAMYTAASAGAVILVMLVRRRRNTGAA